MEWSRREKTCCRKSRKVFDESMQFSKMARSPPQRADILDQSSLLCRPWTEWLVAENEQKLGVQPGPSNDDGSCNGGKSLLNEAHAATFLQSDMSRLLGFCPMYDEFILSNCSKCPRESWVRLTSLRRHNGYRHDDDAPGSPGSSGVRSPQTSSLDSSVNSSLNSSSGSLLGPPSLFENLQLRDRGGNSRKSRQRRTNAAPNGTGAVGGAAAADANHHSVIEERSDGNFVLKIKKNAILGIQMQQQSNGHKRTRRKADPKLPLYSDMPTSTSLPGGVSIVVEPLGPTCPSISAATPFDSVESILRSDLRLQTGAAQIACALSKDYDGNNNFPSRPVVANYWGMRIVNGTIIADARHRHIHSTFANAEFLEPIRFPLSRPIMVHCSSDAAPVDSAATNSPDDCANSAIASFANNCVVTVVASSAGIPTAPIATIRPKQAPPPMVPIVQPPPPLRPIRPHSPAQRYGQSPNVSVLNPPSLIPLNSSGTIHHSQWRPGAPGVAEKRHAAPPPILTAPSAKRRAVVGMPNAGPMGPAGMAGMYPMSIHNQPPMRPNGLATVRMIAAAGNPAPMPMPMPMPPPPQQHQYYVPVTVMPNGMYVPSNSVGVQQPPQQQRTVGMQSFHGGTWSTLNQAEPSPVRTPTPPGRYQAGRYAAFSQGPAPGGFS